MQIRLNAPRLIGIFGGTFDPVHLGHLALAEAALAQLPLAEVLWLPSGDPGHRAPPLAHAQHRLTMLRLVLDADARHRIDTSELERSAATYTVHTLTRLRAQLGTAQPVALLIGSDSLLTLPTWKQWRELFALAHFAIAVRPGYRPADMDAELAREIDRRLVSPAQLAASASGAVAYFDMPPTDISASQVRAGIAAGRDMRNLLPAVVLAYIAAHDLYRQETLAH